ncbi:predicted protein [Postia placenta Mad-698-R]|uniref:ER-bound oxygenase mpaB/mpaB'/Rubber oxygenase catalytic domain-containing protein n=1 Tax=Postia placenta MAD-698-R-SB12 TaxID=670580 RepID=A0A1X6N2W8_9APHY|nr:hypothetical protein POSPLADRAFT_1046305 [Postia placenta MAD-698-R-SB12]EED79670.1 predicted protein [Postia placenta Mad-698-R]OSX62944.1 hypothetical protein POSPLADRAFT_1046305 [Postia placenta MAD-698-R-SB12]
MPFALRYEMELLTMLSRSIISIRQEIFAQGTLSVSSANRSLTGMTTVSLRTCRKCAGGGGGGRVIPYATRHFRPSFQAHLQAWGKIYSHLWSSLPAVTQIVLAQQVFLDNSIEIVQALLHFSLAGGFASPRIVRTPKAVSYLVPHVKKPDANYTESSQAAARVTSASNERTFTRLLETFQFVLDVLNCSATPPTKKSPPDSYLMPGGQGLAVFSTIPIWCLRRLSIPPSETHISAYLALWRHVGFYLGVSPSILQHHFRHPAAADKFVATSTLHLFSTDDPSTIVDAPTVPILHTASNRPPAFASFEYNCACSYYFLGPALSERVGLAPPRLPVLLRMHTVLLIQSIPHWFARWYPRRGWLEKRREVMREGIARSLRWNLGMRRVSFCPQTDVIPSLSLGEDTPLASGVEEAESVRPNPAGAAVLVRVGVVGLGTSWLSWTRLLQPSNMP